MRRSTFITYAKEQPVAHTHRHTHTTACLSCLCMCVCVKIPMHAAGSCGCFGNRKLHASDYIWVRLFQVTLLKWQPAHKFQHTHTHWHSACTHILYTPAALSRPLCCALLRVSSINHQAAASTLLAFYILKNRYICLNLFASARWSGKRS